jgi:hypothetical protein
MKNMYTEQRQQKQLLEDIKKAENVFVWVGVYEGDGEYLPTTKKVLRELIINSNCSGTPVDYDKFKLRKDGDLYVN